MLTLLHLVKNQLNLNGEVGNIDVLASRAGWSGVSAEIKQFDGNGPFPKEIDAVFIGSGTLAGATEALEALRPFGFQLKELSNNGVPFLALGLGWEILGESIEQLDGSVVPGLGIYPSRSKQVQIRASKESFGYDQAGNLTAGYANHSSEIEIFGGASPWIKLESGFGNSSIQNASLQPAEGLQLNNLRAARLNGPLLAINPHLADSFLEMVLERKGLAHSPENSLAKIADSYAEKARIEIRNRLTRQ